METTTVGVRKEDKAGENRRVRQAQGTKGLLPC